jgi:hypothetical protein
MENNAAASAISAAPPRTIPWIIVQRLRSVNNIE